MITLPYGDEKFKLYGLHKSFGTIVLMLLVLRVVWRFRMPHPAKIESHKNWELWLSKLVHILLYACLFALPLSGWIMSNAGGYPYSFFGLFEMPDLTGKNDTLKEISVEVHEISVFVLIGILGLHMAGAVKHAVIDRDITLQRMLPESAYKASAAIAVVVGGTALLLSSALLIQHELAEMSQAQAIEGTMSSAQEVVVPLEKQVLDAASEVSGWYLVSEESEVAFSISVQGEEFYGAFEDVKADIFFDRNQLEKSHAKVTVRTASVKTSDDDKTGYIVMEPWLFSESFPESSYVISHFLMDGHKFIAKGEFSIRGVTMPLDVPLDIEFEDLEGGKRRAYATGVFTFDRLEYGIGQGSWADSNMVGHNVEVTVRLVAETKK